MYRRIITALVSVCLSLNVFAGQAPVKYDETTKLVSPATLNLPTGTQFNGANITVLSTKAIGTDVQAYDADLTTYAGITPSENVQSLLGCADYAAMRTAIGLEIGTNVQAYDADLTTWAGIAPSTFGQALVSASITAAQGDLLYYDGTNWVALNAGTSGYYLKTQGTAANPVWAALSALPAGTQGDVLYYNGTAWVALGAGTTGQFLMTQGAAANPLWSTPAGGGDVLGPATNADGYVPLWDGANSKTLKAGFAITAAGQAILDDAAASDQRTTLGLGTASTVATGTTNGTIPTRPADNKLSADEITEITSANGVLLEQTKLKDGFVDLAQVSAPGAPDATTTRIYTKTDGKLYIHPNGGAETEVGAGGAVSKSAVDAVNHTATAHSYAGSDVVAGATSAYPLDANDILLYHFDGDVTNALTDYDGTAYNTPTYTDVSGWGKALTLNPTALSQYVRITTPPSLGNGDWAVSIRFKAVSFAGNPQILNYRCDFDGMAQLGIDLWEDGNINMWGYFPTHKYLRPGAGTISTGVQYTLLVQRVGNTMSAYLNGSEIGTAITDMGNAYATDGDMSIGCGGNGGPAYFFNGQIDEFKVRIGASQSTTAPTTPYGQGTIGEHTWTTAGRAMLAAADYQSQRILQKTAGLSAAPSAKTANYTLTTADSTGCFSNVGAGGTVTLTLPAKADGLIYTAIVEAAQTLEIEPDSTDQIFGLTNAGGDKITNATIGGTITLRATAAGWYVVTSYGTWADGN